MRAKDGALEEHHLPLNAQGLRIRALTELWNRVPGDLETEVPEDAGAVDAGTADTIDSRPADITDSGVVNTRA